MNAVPPNASPDSSLLRPPPQNIDAERSVLAAMMMSDLAIGRAVEMLRSDMFYRSAHARMFDAMVSLWRRGERADNITVVAELRQQGELDSAGGMAGVCRILESYGAVENLPEHARLIRDKYLLRQLRDTCLEVGEACLNEQRDARSVLELAEAGIFRISEDRLAQPFVAMAELVEPTLERMVRMSQHRGVVTGVPSGLPALDELTAGWQAGDLVIIAGRPSSGKSAIGLNIAENMAMGRGGASAFFSLEMSREQLAMRSIASCGGLGLHHVRTGRLSEAEWPRVSVAAGMLAQAPIWIDDSPYLTVNEIRAKARRLRHEQQIELVIVDYLQLIRSPQRIENRVHEVGEISRGLKGLAKELELPVVALAQLSRQVEMRDRLGRPQLSDLRESGSIEQDADVVIFVWRKDHYQPESAEPWKATLIVAKQRNGATDEVPVTFMRDQTKFVSYVTPSQPWGKHP